MLHVHKDTDNNVIGNNYTNFKKESIRLIVLLAAIYGLDYGVMTSSKLVYKAETL